MVSSWVGVRCGSMCAGMAGFSAAWAAAVGACARPGIGPGTEVGVAPGTEAGLGPGTEAEADPGTEAEADPGTEAEADPGTETEADPGTETEADPGAGPGDEAEAGAGGEVADVLEREVSEPDIFRSSRCLPGTGTPEARPCVGGASIRLDAVLLAMVLLLACFASDVLGRTRCGGRRSDENSRPGVDASPHHTRPD